MPFPLGLCLNIAHSLNSSFIFRISYAIFGGNNRKVFRVKYVFLKLRIPDALNKDTNLLQ